MPFWDNLAYISHRGLQVKSGYAIGYYYEYLEKSRINAVILLAGVQGISSEIYESADIDGANVVQKFFKITMPLLKPTIVFVTIISMINSFQAFDQIYVMTKGGPGTATQVVSYLIYMNAFQYFKQGYASAMAYILFIIVFIASIVQLRFSEKNSNLRREKNGKFFWTKQKEQK